MQQWSPFDVRSFSARYLSLQCGQEREKKPEDVDEFHCLVGFNLKSCLQSFLGQRVGCGLAPVESPSFMSLDCREVSPVKNSSTTKKN